MTTTSTSYLQRWLDMRSLTETDVMTACQHAPFKNDRGVSYENVTGLDRIWVRDGMFHFRDGRFVVLHVDGRSFDDVSPAALLAPLGKPAAILTSRAGRGHRRRVYPSLGIAVSSGSDAIDYIDIFHPTDLETYKALYRAEFKFPR
jgi:hypothetical protein